MDFKERYDYWMEHLPQDDELRIDLEGIREDEKEIRERFYKDLSFGTAGLRGILCAGTNRMNRYTVGRAAQGIADFIREKAPDRMKDGIVIAHDPRHMSPEFCRLSAAVFAQNGIPAYVFASLRPTPQLAFLVRRLGTVAGVNITASHNPRDYNGYKVYWSDGCQVGEEIAAGMTEKIYALDYFSGIRWGNYESSLEKGMITVLGPERDREYLDEIEKAAIYSGDDLDLSIPIIYTPLNGAGAWFFSEMMKDRGFDNWHMVPEQSQPDPDFTTVPYPNPEFPEAFALSRKLGRETGAQLLMATDPDADRFAIEIAAEDGKTDSSQALVQDGYLQLNGNQTGYILVNYILEGRRAAGTLPERGAMVKSIVTSTLSTEIARAYGVEMFESLTGFKNICGKIPEVEAAGYEYIFGYEESVGYAACPYIRDKDGISAGMLVAEAAAYYAKQGKTLYQVLEDIYAKYGYYAEDEPNLVLEGIEGAERIGRMMAAIRQTPPDDVGGYAVEKIIDYIDGADGLPPTNALRFFLSGGSWFAMRPSGTEPKIKFYFYAKGKSREDALRINACVKEAFMNLVLAVE